MLLLEQGTLSCGTTWHAAGLVGLLRASESGTRLVQYSAELYQRLEAETGLGTGYRQCGGLIVARTDDRMTALRRTAATAAAYDLECELLTPEQAGERYPLLRTDDLAGAIWLPGDGTANPTDVTQSLAKGARQLGVTVRERVRVTGFDVVADPAAPGGRRVRGVRTDHGDVECEVVVNCAGQWAKAVGAMAGVGVPLHSAEHFYVVTDQIEGVHRDLPILRDPDGWTYVKEEVGGLVVGGFEPEAKPWVSPEEIPYPFEFQLLDEDWEHFSVLMESARAPPAGARAHRHPQVLQRARELHARQPVHPRASRPTSPASSSAPGFNSVGIASAGGAGRALARVGGRRRAAGGPRPGRPAPVRALPREHPVAARAGLRGARPALRRAVAEPRARLGPAVPLLARARPAGGRGGRGSAPRWAGSGPTHVAPPGVAPADRAATYGWGRQPWHDWVDDEQRATREAVALFDQTSFGKLRVHGPDALALLHLVCTADVDRPVGSAVYTGILNARGGYEADVTATRVADDEWLLVTSAASPVRDADWLRRHVAPGWRVVVEDVTTAYAVFGVMGPRSRDLLGGLTSADLGPDAFPFATSQVVDLGPARVRATRMTYVGELGWELTVPTELATGVWDRLVADGADLGLRLAGYYAINALRLDKGYRAFGPELGPDRSPVEAGLTFTCDLSGDRAFVGREVVERQRADGPTRRLASFVVDDPHGRALGR